jgi:proline iminopeptidase
MVSAEGYIAVENGVRLFFRKLGAGAKTLIVLNGFYLLDDFKYLAEDRTVIFLDLRNRGYSDYLTDNTKLTRGVLNDVDDIEAVRRHFNVDQIQLFGHSYAGKTAILYAIRHPARVERVVLIGAMRPDENTQYPEHGTGVDSTLEDFFAKAAQLEKERPSLGAQEFCRKFWALLRVIYVADPLNASRLHWEPCDLPTELNLMAYWLQHLFPSIRDAIMKAMDLQHLHAPVLVIHGTMDRSSPYGGARDWAAALPNARLLTVENAAHVPWIEAPERVHGPVGTFLEGAWPDSAEQLRRVSDG